MAGEKMFLICRENIKATVIPPCQLVEKPAPAIKAEQVFGLYRQPPAMRVEREKAIATIEEKKTTFV